MARTAKKPVLTVHVNTMPSEQDILGIPLAKSGEYELSDIECKRLRSRIYAINKDNAAGWRFRTIREGTLLLVWRIR